MSEEQKNEVEATEERQVPAFDMEAEFARAKESMKPFANGAANEVRRAEDGATVETTVNLIQSSGNYEQDSFAARDREREADRGMLEDDEYLRRELEARSQQFEIVRINPLVSEPKAEGATFEARVEQKVEGGEGGSTGEGGQSEAAIDRTTPTSMATSRQASTSSMPATVPAGETKVIQSSAGESE